MVTINDIMGSGEDKFSDFDLTEIQEILQHLASDQLSDIPHAEMVQVKTLRAADLLSEYLSRIVKTTSMLESKVSSLKNKVALEYDPGSKVTADMRKYASESDPDVVALQETLARAKGAKALLEKKYDVIIKYHHHAKDITQGLRKTILGHSPVDTGGW